MKNFFFYIGLSLITLILWKYQLLKEPAVKFMSTTLPNPRIDFTHVSGQLPKADFNLRVKYLESNLVKMSDYRDKVIFLNFWAT